MRNDKTRAADARREARARANHEGVRARVYGNQYGTWVVFDDATLALIDQARAITKQTREEFLAHAVNEYTSHVTVHARKRGLLT